MASTLIVEVCNIREILEHPNAHSLELAVVKGWECIVSKGRYKVGDLVVYIPVDSVLPIELGDRLGVRNYLGGKNNDRVRCAKLRGVVSYGLLIDNEENWEVGTDVREHYGITKYEPPLRAKDGDAAPDDPMFSKYTDIENIRNFPDIFKEGEKVVVTEKIDGCFREDQKIMLPNGEQISISEVKIGDMVLSYDMRYEKFVPSMVENVIKQKAEKNWVNLEFDNGKTIVCTENHWFLTNNRGWVKAKELESTDSLLECREKNNSSSEL